MSDARFAVFRPSKFLEDKYHNGDTWSFDIDTGYNMHFHTSIRIIGYNAPERSEPLGPSATAYARSKLKQAREILIKTTEKMSASRWLAFIQIDGVDFAQLLQAAKDKNFEMEE